jgi:SAM-dependent methyltransferase
MICRNCKATIDRVFVDLGTSPLSNAYVSAEQLDMAEPHFPLRPYICDGCLLVQLPVFETPQEIFGEYAFFSGQSMGWRQHCILFAEDAMERFTPGRVLELASNDGTLLAEFCMRPGSGVVATGVEPARNIARQALLAGIPTIDRFFTQTLAEEIAATGYRADLIVANNVLAHVPDLDDFIGGIKTVLAEDGVVSIEVPSLVRLIEGNQFDTIYHEHFSYFTARTVCDVLWRRGLYVFDVEELPVHGGSLRVYAQHRRPADAMPPNLYTPRKNELTTGELVAGYAALGRYIEYAGQPAELKQRMLEMLTLLRHEGRRIAGYGAPAKATTFLSYLGIGPETIELIVDSTPAKQGKYLPGARIPIYHPDQLQVEQPDVILILPWNWAEEILAKIRRDCPWEPMVLCRDVVLADGKLAAAA